MCDKAILEHGGTLESVPDCYKNQEIYDKAVNNYLHALRFVPDSYITQKMSDKFVNTYHSTIQFVPDCYQAKEMFVKAIYIYIYIHCIKSKFCFCQSINQYETDPGDQAIHHGGHKIAFSLRPK